MTSSCAGAQEGIKARPAPSSLSTNRNQARISTGNREIISNAIPNHRDVGYQSQPLTDFVTAGKPVQVWRTSVLTSTLGNGSIWTACQIPA